MGAEQLRQYLPPTVFEILLKALQEAEDHLARTLKLKRNELEWVDGVFSQNIILPIQANRQKIGTLQNNIRRTLHLNELCLQLFFLQYFYLLMYCQELESYHYKHKYISHS